MPLPRRSKTNSLAEDQLQELRLDLSMNKAMTQILEWQARFGERFDNLEKSISTLVEQHGQIQADIEKRVRSLEDWRTGFRGSWKAIVGLSAFVGWLVSLITAIAMGWVGK